MLERSNSKSAFREAMLERSWPRGRSRRSNSYASTRSSSKDSRSSDIPELTPEKPLQLPPERSRASIKLRSGRLRRDEEPGGVLEEVRLSTYTTTPGAHAHHTFSTTLESPVVICAAKKHVLSPTEIIRVHLGVPGAWVQLHYRPATQSWIGTWNKPYNLPFPVRATLQLDYARRGEDIRSTEPYNVKLMPHRRTVEFETDRGHGMQFKKSEVCTVM